MLSKFWANFEPKTCLAALLSTSTRDLALWLWSCCALFTGARAALDPDAQDVSAGTAVRRAEPGGGQPVRVPRLRQERHRAVRAVRDVAVGRLPDSRRSVLGSRLGSSLLVSNWRFKRNCTKNQAFCFGILLVVQFRKKKLLVKIVPSSWVCLVLCGDGGCSSSFQISTVLTMTNSEDWWRDLESALPNLNLPLVPLQKQIYTLSASLPFCSLTLQATAVVFVSLVKKKKFKCFPPVKESQCWIVHKRG